MRLEAIYLTLEILGQPGGTPIGIMALSVLLERECIQEMPEATQGLGHLPLGRHHRGVIAALFTNQHGGVYSHALQAFVKPIGRPSRPALDISSAEI